MGAPVFNISLVAESSSEHASAEGRVSYNLDSQFAASWNDALLDIARLQGPFLLDAINGVDGMCAANEGGRCFT